MSSFQIGSLRDALVEAGASPASASRAAEDVASFDHELKDLSSNFRLLRWMIGFVMVTQAAFIANLFAIWMRLGDIAAKLH